MATTEKATILRRVAQVIEDLQTVNLLSKKGVKSFSYNFDDSISITLICSSSYNFTFIKKAFCEEFKLDYIFIDESVNSKKASFKIYYA